MMTSKSTHTDSDSDVSNHMNSKTPVSKEEVTLTEEISTDIEHQEGEIEKTATHIELPEPDAENITVLTHKLPNKPILPWNHYDSPWEESELEETKEPTSKETPLGDEQEAAGGEMDEVE